MPEQKPRQIAAEVLRQRLLARDYTENLLDKALQNGRLSPPDRGLCLELVYGVARWESTLNWLIARKTGGRTQKEMLQILLQMGLYQMFWLDRIPNHAAVNETVELTRPLGLGPQSGFVNAVLRGYTREREATEKLLEELKIEKPALGHSHPDWLYQRWLARWGADKAAKLMEWNNTPPPTFARVNTLKTQAANLTAQWEGEKVTFAERNWDWTGRDAVYHLESHPSLATLRSFQQGMFYVQDPSTLLAVRELNPLPGETVLDLCAAPGGKTTYIAQRMANRGRVVATDNQPDRLELVRENCARLGVTCVETAAIYELSHATALRAPSPPLAAGERDRERGHTISKIQSESLLGSSSHLRRFDRILVDAPCSNTGVMRRRVDLRWRIRPEEITRLCATQVELLDEAAAKLAPGGTLVYSTCSLEPEENCGVVQKFLGSNPQFKLEHERELLPFVDCVDGAYVARLMNGPR